MFAKKRFIYSVVGGTFDRFHKGHKKLLDTAFSESQIVTIGVSTEKLYPHKFLSQFIEDYETRVGYIKAYLKENNVDNRANIISIDDIYGTTLEEKEIDAIIITEENEGAAGLINQKRKEINLPPLQTIIVPLLRGSDGENITSERIRRGEIDREGNSYLELFAQKSLTLPAELRPELRKPIGLILHDMYKVTWSRKDAPMVIAVGDIVSLTLLDVKFQADISLIDYKTRRHELNTREKKLLASLAPADFVATNEPGTIEKNAVEFLQKAIEQFLKNGQQQTMTITGEEDLLTLPAILLAPLNAIVLYGLFDEGAVMVQVTEQKKQEVYALLKQFK